MESAVIMLMKGAEIITLTHKYISDADSLSSYLSLIYQGNLFFFPTVVLLRLEGWLFFSLFFFSPTNNL